MNEFFTKLFRSVLFFSIYKNHVEAYFRKDKIREIKAKPQMLVSQDDLEYLERSEKYYETLKKMNLYDADCVGVPLLELAGLSMV